MALAVEHTRFYGGGAHLRGLLFLPETGQRKFFRCSGPVQDPRGGQKRYLLLRQSQCLPHGGAGKNAVVLCIPDPAAGAAFVHQNHPYGSPARRRVSGGRVFGTGVGLGRPRAMGRATSGSRGYGLLASPATRSASTTPTPFRARALCAPPAFFVLAEDGLFF